MSSYLNIYLEKKKKEGNENGERLLLCSITRANPIYSLFYDNDIGILSHGCDGNYHEFGINDIQHLIADIDQKIVKELAEIANLKELLPLLTERESVVDTMDQINANKDYMHDLMEEKITLNTICTLFADISKDWCDFNKLYWKID